MGKTFRSMWMPFMLPEELPAPDCPPVRVRLLGEDLVAFRDSEGRIGLLDRYCPHRRVDLFFGRNEECGLRCVYHGWKFDVTGKIVDMPAEPENTQMKEDTRIKSYPVIEWGGVIWAYMGDQATMPAKPPEMEWGLVPAEARFITKRLQRTNYAQGVEGGIDSSHVGILHSHLDPEHPELPFRQRQISPNLAIPYLASDTAPRFFIRPTNYGMAIGARRNASDEEYYWRVTQYLAPFYTMIAPLREGRAFMGHAWTPIDDHNCWVFTMTWNSDRPLDADELDHGAVHSEVTDDGTYRPLLSSENDYGLDRVRQKLYSSTGIEGIGMQDTAIQESMGAIVDRSVENLGSGDAAIAGFRRSILKLAKERESSARLEIADNPQWFRVRSTAAILPHGTDFLEGTAAYTKVD
ncbi:Rieske 2Fe-2S domain-containing protein [Paraburkholderia ginsengiterrae]|nr:Rieske 2Fe-2S domain-containing protein [Paraburkholderia ginsengiterrae]